MLQNSVFPKPQQKFAKKAKKTESVLSKNMKCELAECKKKY